MRPARWDAALGEGQGALRLDVLVPCEAALPGLAWRLLTASRGEALVGVAAGYAQSTHLRDLVPAALGARLAWVPPLRVLELGPPVCPGPPAVVQERVAWERLIDAALAEVRDERFDLLAVRDFAGRLRTEEEAGLAARGFSTVTSRDTWVLALPFARFDGYLSALRSDYRRRAQASLALPLRTKVIRDFSAHAEPVARLIDLTTRRSSASRTERVDAALLARWAAAKQTAALLVEDEAGALLAAAVLLTGGPVVHFLRCGFDEAVGRASGAYLRLLFELVRFAIDEGAQYLDLGVTSAEPKARLGAEAVPLRVWAFPRRPWVRAALRLASPVLSASKAPPPRRVFRRPAPPVTPWWYRPVLETGVAAPR